MVLLDTNALLLPVQFGIDLFAELQRILGSYSPLILEGSLRELERIGEGKGRDAAAARVGHALAERCGVIHVQNTTIPVDEQIVHYADHSGCVVVTNDIALKNKLMERGIRVIRIRKRKTLEISG